MGAFQPDENAIFLHINNNALQPKQMGKITRWDSFVTDVPPQNAGEGKRGGKRE